MLKRSQNFCPVSLVFQKAAIVKQMVIVLVKMEGMFYDIHEKLISFIEYCYKFLWFDPISYFCVSIDVLRVNVKSVHNLQRDQRYLTLLLHS